MKKMNKYLVLIIAVIFAISCQDDDNVFGDINAPNGLQVTADIVGKDASNPNGDGSGKVNFKTTAANAISYKYLYSDGSSENSPSGVVQKRFTLNGTNTYSVTVIANGTAGVSSSITFDITVKSNFSDPTALQNLTGGSSKKWYWAAAEPGHLGVGQNDGDATKNYYANYYQAGPFEKAGSPSSSCLYDNELTFSLQAGVLKYVLDNKGKTFFNAAFKSVVGGTATDDNCYDYSTAGLKTVILGPSDSVVAANNIAGQTTGTTMTFSDGGFMGYYIGQTKYEILSLTANRMVVRAVMGGNNSLAWYHIFSTSPPVQPTQNFTNLVFFDEFDTAGAPNAAKWTYDLGTNNGWGNNEAQNYTNNATNVVVANGMLKITAKKEASGGAQYSSARLTTNGIYSFKYGKAVIRAKLPTGAGTWPAIWMLGQNYATNTWPACGEIDIMEHVGNQQNKIFNTLHYPGNFGGSATGNAGAFTNATASTAFHDYSVIWTASTIKFYVDDTLSYTFTNSASLPFNANFFLILNVAMGGNFGGAIDPAFTQAAMEIDYVRVYQ
jgi:Glycosyl hydrolases family 16